MGYVALFTRPAADNRWAHHIIIIIIIIIIIYLPAKA